jgi:peptidoglycan/LPS O-acetylase OafA/YrhL
MQQVSEGIQQEPKTRAQSLVPSAPGLPGHVNALDGYRGFAVLAVITGHYLSHQGLGKFALATSAAWTGVDAFLVLSAYLITSILYRQRGSDRFFQRFYTRRALRLFPLYYFIVLLTLALTPILHIHWRLGHIPFFLYATNIVLPWDQSLGGLGPLNFHHLWTLALEEQFYLVWPWFVGSRLSRAALIRVCWIGIVVAFFLRVYMVHYDLNGWVIYQSLPTRMDSLLVGALLALSPLPSVRTCWIGVLGGLACFLAVILHGHTIFFTSPEMMTVGYSAVALLYVSLLALALHRGTLLQRLLTTGWLRQYGKYSYGLYLWHYIFFGQVLEFEQWMATVVPVPAVASLLSFAICLSIATLIAVLSYHFIEAPFLRLKRRYES